MKLRWLGFNGIKKKDWWAPKASNGMYETVYSWGPVALAVKHEVQTR